MARIRSIHPGLWTDEAFVGLSDPAQLLYLGLLTEADDQGIFEWKPITLQMRLRPTKGPVDELLSELERAEKIVSYELVGRKYGAIRNFRLFQRPKKPNSVHPIKPELRTYVGLERHSGEPDRVESHPVPQKGEKSPQMEDGGWRGGDSSVHKNERPLVPKKDDFDLGDIPPRLDRRPKPVDLSTKIFTEGVDWLQQQTDRPRPACQSLLGKWRKIVGDEGLIAILGAAQREGPIDAIAWIEGAIKQRTQPKRPIWNL
jgi:hypothetical protein